MKSSCCLRENIYKMLWLRTYIQNVERTPKIHPWGNKQSNNVTWKRCNQIFFQWRYADSKCAYEKMFSITWPWGMQITTLWGSAKQLFKWPLSKSWQERKLSNRNSDSLVVEMQTGAATLGGSSAISYKTEHNATLTPAMGLLATSQLIWKHQNPHVSIYITFIHYCHTRSSQGILQQVTE